MEIAWAPRRTVPLNERSSSSPTHGGEMRAAEIPGALQHDPGCHRSRSHDTMRRWEVPVMSTSNRPTAEQP